MLLFPTAGALHPGESMRSDGSPSWSFTELRVATHGRMLRTAAEAQQCCRRIEAVADLFIPAASKLAPKEQQQPQQQQQHQRQQQRRRPHSTATAAASSSSSSSSCCDAGTSTITPAGTFQAAGFTYGQRDPATGWTSL